MKKYLFLGFLCFFVACSKKSGTDTLIITDPNTPVLPHDGSVIRIKTDGQIVDEPKVKGTMKIMLKDSTIFESAIGIEIRGAVSQLLYEKKSYALELWDAQNVGISKTVLGMPEEEDWVLHGPYGDKTLIRNAIAYQVSNSIGKYAARTSFVELEINGNYKGVYVLMEKLKRDKNRIDLKKLEPIDNDSTKITGGYILKLDKTAGEGNTSHTNYTTKNSFSSLYNENGQLTSRVITHFLYDYPSQDDISVEQSKYIRAYVQEFEKVLASDNFKDTQNGYNKYMDADSFIDFFLLTELFQNHDGYRLSTYLTKERGEKLKMGPIWDFDITFGSDGFCSGMKNNVWVFEYNNYCPTDTWLVPFWWKRLLQDPFFSQKLKARWAELRKDKFSDSALESFITDQVAYLNKIGAVKRNFERWPILSTPIVPNTSFIGTYDQEITRMKAWLKSRTAWIDGHITQL